MENARGLKVYHKRTQPTGKSCDYYHTKLNEQIEHLGSFVVIYQDTHKSLFMPAIGDSKNTLLNSVFTATQPPPLKL